MRKLTRRLCDIHNGILSKKLKTNEKKTFVRLFLPIFIRLNHELLFRSAIDENHTHHSGSSSPTFSTTALTSHVFSMECSTLYNFFLNYENYQKLGTTTKLKQLKCVI
jgi:hypothetical protein